MSIAHQNTQNHPHPESNQDRTRSEKRQPHWHTPGHTHHLMCCTHRCLSKQSSKAPQTSSKGNTACTCHTYRNMSGHHFPNSNQHRSHTCSSLECWNSHGGTRRCYVQWSIAKVDQWYCTKGVFPSWSERTLISPHHHNHGCWLRVASQSHMSKNSCQWCCYMSGCSRHCLDHTHWYLRK